MHLARNTVYEKINSRYVTTRFLHQDTYIYIYILPAVYETNCILTLDTLTTRGSICPRTATPRCSRTCCSRTTRSPSDLTWTTSSKIMFFFHFMILAMKVKSNLKMNPKIFNEKSLKQNQLVV